MDRLWTPWRYAYISGSKGEGQRPGVAEQLAGWPGPATDCVFCNLLHSTKWGLAHGLSDAERYSLLVARWPGGFVCLNRFPYSSGHLLVVPARHIDSLAALTPEEATAMMGAVQEAEAVLRRVYRPAGLNLGVNLGEAAGAGVADHLHLHALPRWAGDTNFMTVTAETRILPEMLEVTWQRVRDAFRALRAEATPHS